VLPVQVVAVLGLGCGAENAPHSLTWGYGVAHRTLLIKFLPLAHGTADELGEAVILHLTGDELLGALKPLLAGLLHQPRVTLCYAGTQGLNPSQSHLDGDGELPLHQEAVDGVSFQRAPRADVPEVEASDFAEDVLAQHQRGDGFDKLLAVARAP